MIKQVYKSEILTRTKVVNRIIRMCQFDTPITDWYKEARDFALYLAAMYGQPFEVCAGVIAALSPVKEWNQNKTEAERFLKTGNAGHIPAFVQKASSIVAGADILTTLNGNKIKSFYLNIIGDKDAVTIDRHALSVALGRKVTDADYAGMTNKQYDFFADCYRHAASKLKEAPSKVQAIAWVNFKNYENINRKMAA